MSTLTLRTAKGSPLTNAEVDANFTNLLIALGGSNVAPYTLPTPTGTGSPVLNISPTFTGTVSGISASMVGLGNVTNTSDANKPVSTAQQTALDLKANLASPTFTGTVSGITKTMVGLGSVDNTADSAKPVSTTQQTALNLKANLASPTFTGNVLIGAGASTTRFPNALSIASSVSTGGQAEPHVIGMMGEGLGSVTTSTATGLNSVNTITLGAANAAILVGQGVSGTGIAPNATVTAVSGTSVTLSANNIAAVSGTITFANYGVGLYGAGYTSGLARSGGVIGEGHVSATGDGGSAVGVRGYANDTHAGGMNIGLYGDATGGATNYALYINRGGVFSTSSLDITAPSLGIPTGGTGARPGTPVAGYLRFNSDLTTFEGYNGSKWGSIGGGLTPTTIKTANGYTATSNDLVRCDTTSGAFSITFPTSPTDGDIIGVVDITGNFNTANLTINRGGTTTIESDTSLILDMNGTYVSFVYSSTGTNWKLLETPVGSLGNVSTSVTLTGLTKGTGNTLTNATAGTDYLAPPSGTSLLKANSGGALSNATAGTDYLAPPSGTSLLKANSGGALTAASAGTDYVAPGTATTFTKPQTPSTSAETAPSTNAVTWDLTTNQIFRINLNANITTFNLTGTLSSLVGNQYEAIVRYNGGSTISWNANMKWTASTAPTLTGTSGKIDVLTFVVASTDGTNYYLVNTGIKLNVG